MSLRSFALPVLLLSMASVMTAAAAHSTEDQAASGEALKAAVATAEKLRDTALAGSRAFELTASLTTNVGHRMAGTANDTAGVAWAKSAFERLGFDVVRLQPVEYPVWRRGLESAMVLSPSPQPLAITALGRSIGTPAAGIEAEVLAFSDFAALLAAPENAAQGRIVYIANRMERHRSGLGYSPAVKARSEGAIAAASKGAVALLIRSIGTDDWRSPHTGNMKEYPDGTVRIPAAALANPDADQLERLLAGKAPVRVRLKLDVGMQPGPNFVSHNVIGEIRGRERPEEVVLLAAHLDSWDPGTGAIDDATGVAITMAAAALIGELPMRPKRTIRVVAFANEEQGLYGAKAYDAALDQAALAGHLVGAESDFGANRIHALRMGTTGEPLRRFVETTLAPVLEPLGIVYEATGGGAGADIGPLKTRGVAWVQLAQDGTDYFDYHHTANDVLARVDAKALDQQVAAYAAFAWLMAEAAPAPTLQPEPPVAPAIPATPAAPEAPVGSRQP